MQILIGSDFFFKFLNKLQAAESLTKSWKFLKNKKYKKSKIAKTFKFIKSNFETNMQAIESCNKLEVAKQPNAINRVLENPWICRSKCMQPSLAKTSELSIKNYLNFPNQYSI